MQQSLKTVSQVAIIVACASTLVLAKGETTKITISGGGLPTPIAITDPDIIATFNVWTGPGTSMTVNGVTREGSKGFIIDWNAGAVADRPHDARSYEVAFYVNFPNRPPSDPAYVVIYEPERDGSGLVYLPGVSDPQYRRNVATIVRGVEGKWFRATRAWDAVVAPLLARAEH
jgi:hypothetical protein